MELDKMAGLFGKIAKSFGYKEFPSSYLVLDCETSGFSPIHNKPIQLGLCPVLNRSTLAPVAIDIRWPSAVLDTFDWGMISRCSHITREQLEAGVPPREAFDSYWQTIKAWLDNNTLIVGHNLLHFDVPFFNASFSSTGVNGVIPELRCLDTGAIVKAVQLCSRFVDTDTFLTFAKRVFGIHARGVRWSLEYCITAYGLDKLGCDVTKAHNAGYDCFVTAILLEELRQRAEVHAIKEGR